MIKLKTGNITPQKKGLRMNEKNQLEIFSSGKVSTAVMKNAIPAMIASLMILVYNVADTFFIGQTHDDLQVAAVAVCTPVFLIFMSLGTIFGLGGTSVIARALGEGRTEYAKNAASFCFWSCVGLGVGVSALFLIFMDQLLTLMGVSPDIWNHAKTYMTIVTFSGPFVLISNCFSGILRAEGQAGLSMKGTLIGNIVDMILNPVMIILLGWEIRGAAISTVIGNVLSAVYYLSFYLKGSSILSIKLKDFTVKQHICRNILAIGIPASLGSLLMSVSQVVLNGRMMAYGDMAVAGYGVAGKVTMMTGMLCIGLGQGVQPLLAYCIGARNWGRFREAFKFSMIFALIVSVVMTGVCYVLTAPIVSIVLTNEDAFDLGCHFSRILLTTSFLFGIYFVLTNTLQAMGAAKASFINNLSRQGIIFLPALFILENMMGRDGLIWAQPVVDVISLILAIALYIPVYRKMINE